MKPLAGRLDRFLFGDPDASRRLPLVRISLGLVVVVLVLFGPYGSIYAVLEPSLYRPPGLLRLVLPSLSYEGLVALRILILVSALAFTLGVASRVSNVILASAFGLLNAYVSHFDTLTWNYNTHLNFFLVALCFTNASGAWSIDAYLRRTNGAVAAAAADDPAASFVLRFMQFYVAFLYFLSGLTKLLYTNGTWFTSGATPLAFVVLANGGPVGLWLTQAPWVFKAITLFTGVFELGFLFVFLAAPRWWRGLALIAIGLHIGVYVVMDISFWHLWFLYPALFLVTRNVLPETARPPREGVIAATRTGPHVLASQ
jgi:hypothetical protein